MNGRLKLCLVTLIAAFWAAPALGQMSGGAMFPGGGCGGASCAASSYTGPGDIVSGANAWYGLRGYTAAYSTGSNPAVDLVDQAGANQVTIKF